jgi:hypothetical protein
MRARAWSEVIRAIHSPKSRVRIRPRFFRESRFWSGLGLERLSAPLCLLPGPLVANREMSTAVGLWLEQRGPRARQAAHRTLIRAP